MLTVDGGPLTAPEVLPIEFLWQNAGRQGGYMVRPKPDAPFELISWDAIIEKVRALAAGLVVSGLKPGDRVALWAETSMEWKLCDQAIQAAGGVVVPMYPTLLEAQAQYIMDDSGARMLFTDGGTLDADKVWPMHDLEPLMAEGHDALAAQADLLDARPDLDDPCMIFYTSGTTGDPKGVVHSHRNWSASTHANIHGMDLVDVEDPSILAFLPLSHVAGYAAVLAITAMQGTIAFSTPKRMATDFPAVRPTLMFAVPRLYERIMQKVRDVMDESPIKRRLFAAAEAVAIAAGRDMEDGGSVRFPRSIPHAFFERTVYSKLRRTLGFDRVTMGLTGAAAVRPDLLYFLQGAGIPIVEAYGMTETTGLVTANPFRRFRAGTVGVPMPGTQIAIADDGEILVGGAMLLQHYHGGDDGCITIDGKRWLPTGDIGSLQDGYLAIVDRKKELEVLDTGKMVAPVPIEERLKGVSPLVEDSVLIGTDRSFPVMLIQPAYDALLAWAERNGITWQPTAVTRRADPTGEERTYMVGEDLIGHPKVRALYQSAIDALNQGLAAFEQVRRFDLVPQAFTIDRDELTPTFKKKRRNIVANHKERIERLYA